MSTPGGHLPIPSAEGGLTSASQAGAFGLLDTVPALIWVSDERNAGIWFNRPWLEFTGRDLEQELGFGWTQAIHPDDRASAAGFCQAHFDRREPFLMKFRLRRHDGVYRWMLDHGVPRFSAEGALLGYVGSCVDITGQRESELAIAMHARVLDSMREGVCVADDDGRIVYTNPAEDRMFGYAPGELAGRHLTVLDSGAPEEHVRRAGEVAAQLRERGQWSGEWQNVRKDGTPFTTAVRITTLDLDGRTYRVCVQEDITERNRNRERKVFLDDSKRLLVASLAEESALRTLTRHCVPFLADSASVDLLTESGEIQRVETAHVDPEKEAIVRDMWRRYPYRQTDPLGVPVVLRTGEPQAVFTIPRDAITRFARDAEHLALLKRLNARSYICVPLAARGQVYGALSLVLSESERLYTPDDLEVAIELARRAGIAVDNARLYGQAQRARTLADEARAIAERASRSKSEFLATVSHEIRTPINAIIGYTQLLQLGVAGGVTDEQARQLARIGASGRHLLRLVEDILDLSKIEAGRLSVERDAVVAARAADAAIALIRPQAAAKGITLHDRCEGDRRAAYIGDEQRVQQILANLLSNAVKFTPERGTVRVQCLQTDAAPAHAHNAAHDRWTCIAVSDSGTGIEPEMLESIFQPFVQGDAGYTRTHAGTGLGLTISRRLARMMDGDLTVESAPNSGSTFTLWLPAGAAVAEGIGDPTVDAAEAGAGDPTTTSTIAEGAVVGRLMVDRLDSLLASFTSRVRGTAAVPDARALRDEQIHDHLRSWLASVGQSLILLGTTSADSAELPRDGTETQRVCAERHGEQRYRLGWPESALSGEFAALRDVIGEFIASSGRESDHLRAVLGDFLAEAELSSLRSYRQASADSVTNRERK